jgi:hypothetical protein
MSLVEREKQPREVLKKKCEQLLVLSHNTVVGGKDLEGNND